MAGVLFASEFERRVEEATSEMIPGAEADVAANLEISDMVRSRSVAPRDAVRALRRRLVHANPNVRLLALALTDTCAKNAGLPFLRALASRELTDVVVALCGPAQRGGALVAQGLDGVPQHPAVARLAQRLLAEWAAGCAAVPGLAYLVEAAAAARAAGVPLPAPAAVLPLADARAPPEWTDSAACERCRTLFSLLARKHHCRRCGRTFCQACSGRTLALPEFGLADAVRVCETCYAERTASVRPLPAAPERPRAESPARDPDVAAAIEASLRDSAPPAHYDEEAAVAAAIAASLRESGVPSGAASVGGTCEPEGAPEAMAVTPLERESVVLFAQLAERIADGALASDAEFCALAADMAALRDRLAAVRARGPGVHPAAARDAQRVLGLLMPALNTLSERRRRVAVGGAGGGTPGPLDAPKADVDAHSSADTGVAAPQEALLVDLEPAAPGDLTAKGRGDAMLVALEAHPQGDPTTNGHGDAMLVALEAHPQGDPKASGHGDAPPEAPAAAANAAHILARPSCPETFNAARDDDRPLIEL